jgi:hypothetical protein
VVHGQQLHLIQVDCFFQRLHEAEAELAIFLADVAVDLDVLRGAWNIALPRPNPVADYAGADHVIHEFIVAPVPHEQRGTGAAAAIEFEIVLGLISRDFDLVLDDPAGPQHADDIGLFGLTEADVNIQRILAEIAG